MDEFITSLFNFITGDGLIVARTISILIFGLLAVKLIIQIVNKIFIRTNIEKTASSFVMSIVGVGLYFLLLLGVAKSAGVSTGGFVAIVTTAGLAVSLALQDSLSNLANGFIIVGSRPFIVGDYIEVMGVAGNVKSIGIFNTKLITVDNKIITLPNSAVIGNNVVNYSTNPTRRLDIDIKLSYTANIEKAKQLVMDCVSQYNEILISPEPQLVLTNYGENALELSLRVWLPFETYWDTKFSLNEKILLALREEGFDIPYNKLDVNIIDTKENKQ